jgi:hypothetical protein
VTLENIAPFTKEWIQQGFSVMVQCNRPWLVGRDGSSDPAKEINFHDPARLGICGLGTIATTGIALPKCFYVDAVNLERGGFINTIENNPAFLRQIRENPLGRLSREIADRHQLIESERPMNPQLNRGPLVLTQIPGFPNQVMVSNILTYKDEMAGTPPRG